MSLGLIDKLRLLYLFNKLFKEVTLKNWKTTVSGILGLIGAGLVQMTDPIFHSIGTVLVAVGSLFTALFAKDSDVTGGSRPQ